MDKIEIFEETDRNKKQGKLYIVVPCYNEEEALETSAHSLIKKLEDLTTKGLQETMRKEMENEANTYLDELEKAGMIYEKVYIKCDEIKVIEKISEARAKNDIYAV